jgi:hypothetical protein
MMSKYTNAGNNAPTPAQAGGPQEEERIRVNGFAQVLEMLKIADPDFRESLLRRLGAKDPELGRQLRQDLRKLGLL